jgi:hypothetical protein
MTVYIIVIHVSLEVYTEETKYMVVSRHQNVVQNHNLLIANRSFKNVAEFRYLGVTVMDPNFFREEIKSRLNSRNICHCSVQNSFSFCLLSKNIEIKDAEP